MRQKSLAILALILIATGIGWKIFDSAKNSEGDKKSANKMRPSSVVVDTVIPGDITVTLSAIGTVIPRNSVTVFPQVNGILSQVFFREGEFVRAGQLLAQIDPRTYEAALKQSKGNLERDQNLLKNAELDFKRYTQLLSQESISQQVFDTQKALVAQYSAAVHADQAQVDTAALQLEFSHITAPISGKIGLRQVDPGNLVQSSTALFSIAQISPTTVVFPIPQNQLGIFLKRPHSDSSKHNQATAQTMPIKIEAWDTDNKSVIDLGQLDSVDNIVDLSTGTIKLKAVFPNQSARLFANQFVNVHAILETRKNVLTMPTTAVQRGTAGIFVYKLTQDGTSVEVVPVKLGPVDAGKVLNESGLDAGDRIVVDGTDKLRNGAKVIVSEPSSKRGGTSSTREGPQSNLHDKSPSSEEHTRNKAANSESTTTKSTDTLANPKKQ